MATTTPILTNTPDKEQPFRCTYDAGFIQLLHQLGCSLAISTYQAGKVCILSPADEQRLIQLPRSFHKAMGLALDGQKLAIATLDEIIVLVNSPELAATYPPNPGLYDALYMPRAAYFTGQLDIHDLEWGAGGELYAVNTYFSCICRIDQQYSFTPIWKPPFISAISADDRCHLNGMAMRKGQPAYATAFNTGDSRQSWRQDIAQGGVIIDITTDEIISRGLPMPHSPRLINDKLYVLLSATGQLAEVDLQTGQYEQIFQYNGFLRGLGHIGDYLFIGLSQVRKTSKTFAQLPMAQLATEAGVLAIHLPTRKLVGKLVYETSVEEIYEVKVLPGLLRPNLLNTIRPEYKMGLSTPELTFWAAPEHFISKP